MVNFILTTNKLIQEQLMRVNAIHTGTITGRLSPLIIDCLVLLLTSILLLITPSVSANSLHIEASLSAKHVWQREQVIITIKVQTNDPFGRLQVDNFKQKGFTITPLEKQTTSTKEDESYALIRRWAVFPFVAGEHQLQLPRVRYRPSRGSIKTLDIPHLSLHVKSLPIYIPATMPVGKIELQNTWKNSSVVTSNTLLYWNVSVTATHAAKQTLPAISRQLKTNTSIDFLPIQNTQQLTINKQGVIHQVEYKIPLKAKSLGKLELPILTVQYFDPNSGKLKRAKTLPPLTIVLNHWLLFLITLIGVISLIWLFVFFIAKIKRYRKRTALKEQALKQLEGATSYQQILTAIQQFSLSQGWRKPLTLHEFVTIWSTSLNPPPSSKEASDLEHAIYRLKEDMFAISPLNMVQNPLNALINKMRHRP